MLPLYLIIVIGLMCMTLMSEEWSVIFMESLESILDCIWSKMEEIASWTEEEDGRGGSGVFFY